MSLFTCIAFLLAVDLAAAFVPLGVREDRRLLYETRSTLNGDDTERARKTYEDLFLQDESISAQVFPAATSVSRRRRHVEMELLDSLRDSDDAVGELLHLWVTERDAESAQQIIQMEQECSPGLEQEEQMLRCMIQDNPTWAEPVLRLATLLYYKGCTEESYEMAMLTLELKPWHIEAPQLLVLLALRNQDMGQALFWARRGLPPLRGASPSRDGEGEVEFRPTWKRRRQWVERALEQAQDQLQEAEQYRIELLGKQSFDEEQPHPAWQ